jgi:class 3 adenylate cyclase/pimeloyl-ACP methyl ester carboxylesterase
VRWGEIEYAKAGDHHIAFREVVGDDSSDLEIVMVTGAFFPMESLVDDPIARRLVEGLAGLGRLVLFDRRGVALSDPVSDWELPLVEQWADDLAAVITAADCDRPVVFSWNGFPIAQACAIRHPELIDRLVLFNPQAPVTRDDGGWVAEFLEGMRRLRAGESLEANNIMMESRRRDPAFKAWNDAAGRAGASPTQAQRLDQKAYSDPMPDFAVVRTPTLVISRSPSGYVIPGEFFQRAAHQILGAELVVLPPGDLLPVGLGVDDLLAEISKYLIGQVQIPTPERQIAVIMFTDLVGSTRRAVAEGDAAWKQLLDRHDAVSRREVSHRGGEVIKTTGDGILALVPSATAAIEVARAIRAQLGHDDLQVRIGIHIGEIDRRGDDVSGLAVNIAARIMALGDAGQILTSAVVVQTTDVASFTSIGPKTLKDIDGTWELHAVE